MTAIGWIQIILYCAIIAALVKPLGWYMTRVFNGERTFLSPILRPVEIGLYWIGGVDEKREQHWLTYTVAMLLFHVGGFLIIYGLMRLQAMLPFNPAEQSAVSQDLSFNTAISFITNTNWQNYGGESTLSYLVQMLGLTHQNFLSAATGIALAVALIRGFSRSSMRTIGNFWVDVTRCTLYVLLPICVVFTLFLVWQGMPQTLGAYVDATTLEGAKQTIAVGPVASQVAIKMLGTNGGGFFNANAAHPFENPTALSNFVQMLSIFALGAALTNVFGRMVGNQRQGWAILGVMGVLFIAGVTVTYWAEANGTTALHALGLTDGNMEGKEVRFGIVASSLFAVVTTAASCGAVNAMHDSFTALGGMIPLINMQLGEIIVGGVGAGLYGMLIFVVISIFVAGLMVGRTPEYVGKKIEAREVKMAMLAILVLPLMYLGWTAIAVVYPTAVASMANAGPHGFTEVLYAYTSQTGNNGSAFAGLTGNIPFYNVTGGVAMFVGRFFMIVPAMAIAGSLAGKKSIPASAGTLPTTGGLFVGLVVGVILIIGGLTFFPALALGPIVEHLAMNANNLFLSISSRSYVHGSRPKNEQADAGFGDARSEDRDARHWLGFPQTRSQDHDQEPRDVRGRGRSGADHGHLPARPRDRRRQPCIHLPDHPVAVVHGAVREFGGGRRGRSRQGAGGGAPKDPHRDPGQAVDGFQQRLSAGIRHQPQGRRCRAGRSRRQHPFRRRGDRRCRLRQRGRDYRRIRARDPRIRRRPFGGHRRHTGIVGLDSRAHHRGPRIDLHRPHDQARRRRRAAADPERDRAQYPARGPHHHLRVRDGDDPELCGLCRRADFGDHPGGAVRHVYPDPHRRAIVGDRHCRHGPAGALQRAGDVGPRRRGGW